MNRRVGRSKFPSVFRLKVKRPLKNDLFDNYYLELRFPHITPLLFILITKLQTLRYTAMLAEQGCFCLQR